jgi:hypothetical protein
MAIEFNKAELAEYSSQNGYGYEMLIQMHPYWRSFLLDEHEKARLNIINGNSRSYKTVFSFVAKLTGIDSSQIDSVGDTGNFISIQSTPGVISFKQFLDQQYPDR